MFFITTKFHAILLSGFSGAVMTNCFSSIFHFRQISQFKKGHCSQKKNWIKISCEYARVHILSFITTKFPEILLSIFRGVALTLCNCFSSIFHFRQISKFKKGHCSQTKNGIKISCGYAHLHIMSFITTEFQVILLSDFRGVALTRKK